MACCGTGLHSVRAEREPDDCGEAGGREVQGLHDSPEGGQGNKLLLSPESLAVFKCIYSYFGKASFSIYVVPIPQHPSPTDCQKGKMCLQ